MAYRPLTDIPLSLLGNSSTMLTGGVLRAYVTGTSTPATLYSDADGTSAGTSVTLDARGEPTTIKRIWLDTAVTYKLTLEDADGNVLWTVDPVYGSDVVGGDGSQLTVIATGSAYARTLADRFADVVTPRNWQDLVVDGDWEPAITAAMAACPEHGIVWLDGARTIGATLTVPKDNITIMGPAKLTAKASTNFEYMLYASSKSNILVDNVRLDANKANRSSGQNVRFMGLGFVDCTDCTARDCYFENVRGYSSVPAVGGVIGGTSIRCKFEGCTAANCGDTSYEADGFFSSGESNLIANCTAVNCLDTAFVIESSNGSGIVGCVARSCNVGAAVTNAVAADKYGNYITGLSVYDWDSPVTGGIQIGCPLASSTGSLYDTIVSDVTMVAVAGGAGTGPAINIRQTGTPKAVRVTLNNIKIRNASAQGILVDGDQVHIRGADISGTTDACIQFADGSLTNLVAGCTMVGGSYGIATLGTATCTAASNLMFGQTSYGLYAFDTSTINDIMNVIQSPGVGYSNQAGGATINHVGMISNNLTVNSQTGSAPAGSITDKFLVYDKGGNVLGYVPLYAS